MSRPAPEFLFDFGSPNAYLSHEAIPAIEQRIGVRFSYVPVLLGGIFKATNNKSPAESLAGIKNKREFHEIETQRFLKRYHVQPWVWNPHFPVNTLNLMRAAVAAQAKGQCGGCGYFLPMAGALRRSFGVCTNEWSPSDGTVVSLDHGCGAHSEIDEPAPVAEKVEPPRLDDFAVDVEQAEQPAETD